MRLRRVGLASLVVVTSAAAGVLAPPAPPAEAGSWSTTIDASCTTSGVPGGPFTFNATYNVSSSAPDVVASSGSFGVTVTIDFAVASGALGVATVDAVSGASPASQFVATSGPSPTISGIASLTATGASGEDIEVALGPFGQQLGISMTSCVPLTSFRLARVWIDTAPPGDPTFSVGDASIVEGDTGASRVLRIPVTLSQPSTSTVSVQYTLADITATGAGTFTPGVDYRNNGATKTLTFPVGGSGTTPVLKWISVPIQPDTNTEGDEAFSVTLTNPVGGPLLRDATATATIVDDEGVAGLRVGAGDVSITEGTSGRRNLTVTVSLSAPAPETVAVDVVIAGVSATCQKVVGSVAPAGVDCDDRDGVTTTLLFKPGATAKRVTVKSYPDTLLEPDETANVTITAAAPTNGASTLTVTVQRPVGTVGYTDDE